MDGAMLLKSFQFQRIELGLGGDEVVADFVPGGPARDSWPGRCHEDISW